MIELEEVENVKAFSKNLDSLEALDVTKLALLRPDDHPGGAHGKKSMSFSRIEVGGGGDSNNNG
ncbi:unnamed protein product [Lupinus luteus]|uniref:Uncharacterized protein n=1 Tax=Lupinus luteus TaxID=3873 RepID=A0AAV1VR16_LUPLU